MLVTRRPNPVIDFDQVFFDLPWLRNTAGRSRTSVNWVPVADVREQDDHYMISIELPGIDKKDISVEVEDGVLTIAGERQQAESGETARCHLNERSYGKFNRRFRLPESVDTEQVNADYTGGVLTVRLGKVQADKLSKVAIEVQ